MVYSWTYEPVVYIDGVDVTSAVLNYSLSGNQTSAIVSGSIVCSKRALDAFVTAVTGMSVIVARDYMVSEDFATATSTSITIFRGHITAPTTEGQRTTIQVQDRLKLLLNTEANKIYGTDDQPVDIGEVAYDIITSAGLTANYATGTAAIMPTGVTTKGMMFAHTNAFEALKQLASSVDYQFYYDPRDDYVYFEPKGTRTTDTQSYVKGDFTGRPKWSKDVSDMCNKIGITTAKATASSSIKYTQPSVVDMSTGAYITVTLEREADAVVIHDSIADRWLRMSTELAEDGPIRSMTTDFSFRVRDDGKTDVYIYQNIDSGFDAYYDYAANTEFTISFRHKLSLTYYYVDTTSIATYGEIRKTISRPDLRVGDNIAAVGAAYLSIHANPTEAVTVDLVQDPKKFCFLGGVVDITDAINGRTETGMAVISFTLNYPSKKDQFTFGQHQIIMADYTAELERRIQQIEGTYANPDFTQAQYKPIGGFVEEPDPDVTWTVTPSSATVLASATTTTDAVGYPMQWKTGFASGRHWVFWGDGSNDVYSHSVNGVNAWATKTTLNAGYGKGLSMDFSSNGFHLVRGYDVADLKYRRAVLNSNGTITLNSEVSAEAGGSVNRIHHFSWDTNMNSVYSYMRDNYIYVNRMLKPPTGYDGTWVTDTAGGFPMSVASGSTLNSHVCRLSGDKFIVIYGAAGATVKAKLFDGTTLGSEETCTAGNLAAATSITTAHDNSDEVWMVYTKDAGGGDYRIMYTHRAANGTWDATEQDVVGQGVYSTSVGWIALGYDDNLYVVWCNYPSTDHIYYRMITKEGVMSEGNSAPPATYDYKLDGVTIKDSGGSTLHTGASAYAAVQWAIGTAGHENKTLYIPTGTYDMTSTLTPVDGITMYGDGYDLSILQFTSTGIWQTRRMWIKDVDDVTVKDLQFKYGNIHVSATDENISNFHFTNLKMVETSELLDGSFRIQATGNTNATRKTIEYVYFYNCHSIDAHCMGFLLNGDYNAADSPSESGIINHVTFDYCTATNNGAASPRFNVYVCGFDFNEGVNCYDVVVNNCTATNCYMNGFHHEMNPYSQTTFNACAADDNGVTKGSGYGFLYRVKTGLHSTTLNSCYGDGNQDADARDNQSGTNYALPAGSAGTVPSSSGSGGAGIVDAYTDPDGIASISRANLMPVARGVTTDPETATLDFAYLAGTTPYTLKLFKLTFANSADPEVPVDPDEPETSGTSPIGENYDYICYSDGRAAQKGGTLVDRGSAVQGIQWCIDNCPAGGNILLSPGTYSISGQITLKNNNIYGSVDSQTVTIWDGTIMDFVSTPNVPVSTTRLLATWNDSSGGSGTGAQFMFRRDSAYTSATILAYLELDGGMNYDAANSRAVYGGVGVYRSRNLTIDHCYIHDFCKAGVYIADSSTPTGSTYNCTIRNCEIENIGMRWTSGATRWWGNGIAWGGGGYTTGGGRAYVDNCDIHDCTMHAADFEPGKNSTIQNTRLVCDTTYTDTGSNSKAPWTVGYLAWSGKSSTGNTLHHCFVQSATGWTVVYNGSTTTGNIATSNDCHYHSGGAGFVASGDADLDDQTISNNTETAI